LGRPSRRPSFHLTFSPWYVPLWPWVEADGLTVIVEFDGDHWHVRFKGYEGIDSSLYFAADMALEEGAKTNVSRDYRLVGRAVMTERKMDSFAATMIADGEWTSPNTRRTRRTTSPRISISLIPGWHGGSKADLAVPPQI
jgi:hypothetical protein